MTPARPRTKLLLVDDLPQNLIALEASLNSPDYEFHLAHSGPEAIASAHIHDYAVILLDVAMPGMDGFDTARIIRQLDRARKTPIIFLTANFPSERHALQGYGVGAVDFLFKPLNVEMLRSKVAVFVELFQANQELRRHAELLREVERRDRDREVAHVRRIGERKYERLVESISDGIVWSADPVTFRPNYVSRHAERISGHPLTQWVGEEPFWRRHVPEPDCEALMRLFENVSAGMGSSSIEHRLRATDGRLLWLHTSCQIDREPSDPRRQLLGLSVDVTHLKETETALRESLQARDEFLSVASHELKTPITPLQMQMQGFLRLVENNRLEQVPRETLLEMLRLSESQVNRLSRLVSQLLDVAKISGGQLRLERERIRLSEVVSTVLAQMRHEFEVAEVLVEKQLDPSIEGDWDPMRLEQVLTNLLSNAVKYGNGRPIQVAVRRVENAAQLVVADRGIGIAPQDHARIFSRYERAVSVRHYGGLGLGLYISQTLVELHGGRIRVESAVGQGARFVIDLPLPTLLSQPESPSLTVYKRPGTE